ncbi:MAG: ATP-binding protein, partial [Dehalobacterium sp.]
MVAIEFKENIAVDKNNTFSRQISKTCNLSPSILEDFYNNFFQNSPDAIFLVDKLGEIIWFNQAAEKFITTKGSQVIEKGMFPIIRGIVREAFENQSESISLEKSCIINGNVHTFLWDTRFLAENNKMAGMILIAKDISQSKLEHEEMMRYNMQKIVEQVAAGLAHEIRNPLTAVRGFIQLLHESLRRSSKREYLQVALDELDRANGFIKDFLLFIRPAAPNFSLVPLAQVIEEALFHVRPQALLNGVHFDLISSGSFPLMYLDQEQITQGIRNVLQNAADFTDNGTVRIQVINDEKTEKVTLLIRDPGSGIPNENLTRIFEPFFTTKDDAPGMGLTLAQSIIKNHG